MKQYLIKEYPGLIKRYVVEGNNYDEAYNNFIEDKIVKCLEDDYFESWNDLEIEEIKQKEVA